MNHVVAEARRDLADARSALREAEHAERRAQRQFADGKIIYHELREAIRATALAEKRVADLRAIELNISHIYGVEAER